MEKLRFKVIGDLAKKVPIHEVDYWIYFGHGQGWGDKCDRCMEELDSLEKAKREYINCWKFEIWVDNLTDLAKTMRYLLEEAARDHTLHGKLMKEPGLHYEAQGKRLGTGTSHSYPESAKPDRYLNKEIDQDQVILIYNQSIEERDRRMKKIIGDLHARGLYKKVTAPYRRGCIQPHESILGPWENWHDMDKNWG